MTNTIHTTGRITTIDGQNVLEIDARGILQNGTNPAEIVVSIDGQDRAEKRRERDVCHRQHGEIMSRTIAIPDNLTEEQAREALAHASLVADAEARERSIVRGGYLPASVGVPRDEPDQIITLTFQRWAWRFDPLAEDPRPRLRLDVALDRCTFNRGVPPSPRWRASRYRTMERDLFDDASRDLVAKVKHDAESSVWRALFEDIRDACFPTPPEPLSPEAAMMVALVEAERRKRGEV